MNLDQSTVEVDSLVIRYCALFNSSPNPVVLVDSKGIVRYSNGVYRSQYGDDTEELLHYPEVKAVWEYFTTEIFQSGGEEILTDDKTNIEFRKVELGGELFCLVSIPSTARVTMSLNRSQDRVEHKKEDANEAFFESILKNAPDAVLILDYEQKQYIAANDRAESLLGYTRDELINLKLGELSPGVMDGGASASTVAGDFIDQCIETGQRVVFDWQIRQKDGTLIPCEISVFRLPTQNGIYVRSSIIDISFRNDVLQKVEEQRNTLHDTVNRALQYQREDQLKAFVRDSPIPMVMLDVNMNHLIAAKEWTSQFPSPYGDDIIGRNHYDVMPHVPMRWKLAHKQALKGQTVSMPRDKFIDSEGNEVWCRWQANPWYNGNGDIGGIIIYAQNITDEVNAENKALAHERRFKHFFNSDSIGWIEVKAPKLLRAIQKNPQLTYRDVVDSDPALLGQVVRYNQRVADIFGLSKTDSVKDFKPLEYVVDGVHELWGTFFEAIKRNIESFDSEATIRNKYDEVRNLNVSVHYSLKEGNGEILYGIQDVTDLKESVKALRESEERYRTIFDSNSLGIIYTNYHKGIVKTNDAFANIFGYTESDMQHTMENDMLLPEYREINNQIDKDFKEGVRRYVSVEKEYKRKDGRKIVAQTSSSALYDDSGVHYGNVTIIEDITERKTAERKIRKQNEELIKINQELDQFVYSAAHDLRAPIANVMGLVKLIGLEEISETAKHYLALQEKSLAKLDEFIKSIVDYSRNSRLELAKDKIDLETFVSDIVDQYRFSENAELLSINIDVDQPKAFVSDQNRLSVVMNNLVSNAVRYMDTGKDNSYLNIKVKASASKAVIVVEDNGIGIEKEHLESIFKLFYRANSNSKGTGIGLYIVKETVDKLKGEIRVNSEYGKGTTFKVTLKNFAK